MKWAVQARSPFRRLSRGRHGGSVRGRPRIVYDLDENFRVRHFLYRERRELLAKAVRDTLRHIATTRFIQFEAPLREADHRLALAGTEGHHSRHCPRNEAYRLGVAGRTMSSLIRVPSVNRLEAANLDDQRTRGHVAEATGANIFFVKDGEVHTPKPDAFLNGITRQTVIGMLKDMGVKVHERHIMPEELESFQQCWLTGTAAEVTPVGQIGTYTFEVGDLTKRISSDYEKLVRA